MKFIFTFQLIIVLNSLFGQNFNFSDKLYCKALLDSVAKDVQSIELISKNETIQLKKLESQLFSFPEKSDHFEMDSIQITIDNQELKFSAKNIRMENLVGRTMTLDFHQYLNFECMQIAHSHGHVIKMFEPDEFCQNILNIYTDSGKCLTKFKGHIVSDCALKRELEKEIRNGKPARYE